MIFPKFKIGDVVETGMGVVAKITDLKYSKPYWVYKVQVVESNGSWCPDGFILETSLKFHYDMPKNNSNYVPRHPTCTICSSEWLTSGFGTKRWYDCPKCKQTAEDIENPKIYRRY